MTDTDLLRELETLGSEQTRRTYKRHGVGDNQYGVSYANLSKFQKKIRTDHNLARKLWASGVHDAQILATMIADPSKMTSKEIDKWSKDLSNYVLTDALAGLVSKTSLAREKAEEWTKSKDEWVGSAGWQILSALAQRDPALPESFFVPYLRTIQSDIHTRKNRVRYAMNGALIGIGARNSNLEKKSLTVAGKIGKVEVDHGNTGCKTPDAAEYIANMVKRRQQRMTKTAKA
jgi:3-methyladenine DNA glycosylase AlkD